MTNQKKEKGFKEILKNKKFSLLLASESVSLIGDRILAIVLVMFVYQLTESATTVSILMMLKALPTLLFGGIAGGLVDRLDRKWVMIFSHLAQGLLLLLIPLSGTLLFVYAVYLAMSIINQLIIPARASVIPELVPKGTLMSANSIFSIAYVGAIAIGPAIGGFLVESYGIINTLYVNAFMFFIPALALILLKLPHDTHNSQKQNFWSDMKEGIIFIKKTPDILSALALSGFVYLGIGSLSVLGIILAEKVLDTGAGGYGMMMSSMGVGLLLGAFFVGKWAKKYDKILLAIWGSVCAGLAIILLPFATELSLAIALTVFIGIGTVIVQTSTTSFFQLTPKNIRGKVVGVSQSLMGASSFLAMGLAGFLTDLIGINMVFGIVGSIIIGAALVVWTKK